MTPQEFINHCYHTRLNIVIPALNMKIDKVQFINNKLKTVNKYEFKKEKNYLKDIYEKNKHKLI